MMSHPESSLTSAKVMGKCCVDENTEKRRVDSSDKSPKYLSNDTSPDPCVRDRVLKEVGFTSTTFIGPAFPPEVATVKSDFKDTLKEFYKEIEEISAPENVNNNSGKQDVQPLKAPETSSSKQSPNVPADFVAEGNTEETDGCKISKHTHKSWSHWYQNEPYYLNRPRPDVNSDWHVSNKNPGHYFHPQNMHTHPRFHRPQTPPQSHQSAFPNPQHLPQHLNLPMKNPGMANQYQNEPNIPTSLSFPPPNTRGHPSQGFYENSPLHFGRDGHACIYDTKSDNAAAGWSRDGQEEGSWHDGDYDFDPENKPWEQQHPYQPRDGTNYHPASVLILMRGLPGSGKTTLARELLFTGPSGVILSTDDYFAHIGGYCYDPGLLGAAHEWNQSRAKEALHDGRSPVIIDNTNLQAWEMKPYVRMALERGYRVDFCEPETRWKFDPYELEKRNKHGVPQEKISQMMDRFSFPISIDIVMSSQEPPHVNQRRQPEKTSNKKGFIN